MRSDSDHSSLTEPYRYALLSIYSLVLVGGVVSLSLMINVLQSNVRSLTTTAVLNLIVVHFLFLLTVPFRIYYYAAGEWRLGADFCKVVSGMVHAHMYLCVVFYVVILSIRYVSFYKWAERVEFYRLLHAAGASAAVWVITLAGALPVAILKYGSIDPMDNRTNGTQCFNFSGELDNHYVAVLNYIISGLILLVTLVLAGCQVWILGCVYRRYRATTFAHQEFWAQVKSLCFVLVMVVCFVPYNGFRIYYVKNYQDLVETNEVFLAVTTLSCLDMLALVGRGPWRGLCDRPMLCCPS